MATLATGRRTSIEAFVGHYYRNCSKLLRSGRDYKVSVWLVVVLLQTIRANTALLEFRLLTLYGANKASYPHVRTVGQRYDFITLGALEAF
jgi:hypothetical protein